MAYRTRLTRLLSGVALAATAALAAAGCTSGRAGTATGSTESAAAPAVTTAQATQVFDSYVATSERAARAGDEKLALSEVTGVASSQVSYFFGAFRASRQSPPYTGYAYQTPALYLPAPAGYPRWFAASVTRTPSPPLADSRLDAAAPIVMVFTQASAKAPWLLASTSNVAGTLPALAVDKDGQVPAVAMSQTAGVVVGPDVVGPLLAAVVDDGPSSPAARFVSTAGITASLHTLGRDGYGFTTPRGDVRQWELDGSEYPQFTLRTADGGALVFFAMYLDTTIAVPAELNGSRPVDPGPPIEVPADIRWMLPASTAPRVKLERQDLWSFVAVDPPAGRGKIQILAANGVLNNALAS